ncbi:peptidase inhibitor family I36 protein [Nocardia sp. NPDC052001]|uniref:peptidase inhibitor family I36 protein n=1 Tax=Nocardia sp. NPDC052001 TaxID=3154853 RepID=UPI003438C078
MTITHRTTVIRRIVPLAAAVLTLGAGAAVVAGPASANYDCPGGMFCGYDNPNGTGMIVQVDSGCFLHDIGNGGVGDRLSSYWNRTGQKATVYNWTGREWQVLVTIPDNTRGTMPKSVDNIADAVKICD